MAVNDLFGMGGSGGNDDGGGAAMDIDEELGAHHSGVQVAHNVSMDAGCGGDSPRTPKRRANVGPIFDESEFEPAGIRLQVHQSALTTQQQNQNQQPAAKKKQMTRQEHAKLMREQKQAKFLERRELAQQKMMQSSSICSSSQSNVNNFQQVQTIANASNSNSKDRVVGSQLGQPFRQYSDVSVRLAKLRANFDQIMTGQMSINEVYE